MRKAALVGVAVLLSSLTACGGTTVASVPVTDVVAKAADVDTNAIDQNASFFFTDVSHVLVPSLECNATLASTVSAAKDSASAIFFIAGKYGNQISQQVMEFQTPEAATAVLDSVRKYVPSPACNSNNALETTSILSYKPVTGLRDGAAGYTWETGSHTNGVSAACPGANLITSWVTWTVAVNSRVVITRAQQSLCTDEQSATTWSDLVSMGEKAAAAALARA